MIAARRLRIEPAGRRNEVLAFIDGGLVDFSVSRSNERAHGWGIPVPGDPGQVIYVWWDALGNYLTALGYGTNEANLNRWWTGTGRRVHLLGKGVLRFHAVYWPAMLLSAGLPLPTDILVHDYLTVAGRRISKSSGVSVDPAAVAQEYGTDALRWWLLREVPRIGDADFTTERLILRADDELAHGIGNLVNRVVAMVGKYRDGVLPQCRESARVQLGPAGERAGATIDAALRVGDFRRASEAVWAIAQETNRYISQARPWTLAQAQRAGDRQARERLDVVLAALVAACRQLATELEPFLPDAAARIAPQTTPVDGVLPPPQPVFRPLLPQHRA